VGIVEEPMEIWPNEVCDNSSLYSYYFKGLCQVGTLE